MGFGEILRLTDRWQLCASNNECTVAACTDLTLQNDFKRMRGSQSLVGRVISQSKTIKDASQHAQHSSALNGCHGY